MTYLCVIDVVNFIEDNKFYVSYQIGSFVKHASQNFSRHYEATSFRVDLNVPCQDTNRLRRESLFEISEFLVRKCLDW